MRYDQYWLNITMITPKCVINQCCNFELSFYKRYYDNPRTPPKCVINAPNQIHVKFDVLSF